MVFTVKLNQIELQPGQNLIFHDINWHEFEILLEELGEHRGSRVSYYRGVLEIRMPLPEHEVIKELIGEMVKILLDELKFRWRSYGSTTFKNQEMFAGIEPDICFYIKNISSMIGKKRINLAIDPPPDLAIEIDLTSKTQISTYVALGVPELWCYDNGKLQIFVLSNGEYLKSENSTIFVDIPIIEGILQFLELSEIEDSSVIRQQFREWVQQQKNQHS
ncbi:MAG TPA: Uma2 family endonuclease [Nostocaceae cyanobacterium]|nr:Uma2 family endonuclease [Nostocaceae cyanobacterium]